LHSNFDVLPEQQEKAHQPLQGKAGEPAADESRNLGLIDAEQFGGLNLGKSTFPDQDDDLVSQLGFG